MKKTTIAALLLAALVLAGGAGLYAGRQLTRSRAIGEENAKIFACADAGLPAAETELRRTALGREAGRSVYTLELEGGGALWHYTVDARSGEILRRSREELPETASAGETVPAAELAAAVREHVDTLPRQANEDSARGLLREVLGLTGVEDVCLNGSSPGESKYDFAVFYPGEKVVQYTVDAARMTVQEKGAESWSMDVHQHWRMWAFHEQMLTGEAAAEAVRQEVLAAAADRNGDGITKEEARTIVRACLGLDAQGSYFTKLERDDEDGEAAWAMVLTGPDGIEYNCRIRIKDGMILKLGTTSPMLTEQERIGGFFYTATEEEAKTLAAAYREEKVEDLSFEPVEETENYGRTVYSIAFTDKAGRRTECLVDANLFTVTDKALQSTGPDRETQVPLLRQEEALAAALEASGYDAEELTGCYVWQHRPDTDYSAVLFVRGKGWFSCTVPVSGGKLRDMEPHPWDEEAEEMERRAAFELYESMTGKVQMRCGELSAGIRGTAGHRMLTLEQAKLIALSCHLLTANVVTFTDAMYGTAGTFQIGYTVGEDSYNYEIRETDGKISRGGGRVRPPQNVWDAALTAAGVTEADLLLREADIDWVGGSWLYRLSFRDRNGTDYRYEADVRTGELRDLQVDPAVAAYVGSITLTKEQAMRIAMERAGVTPDDKPVCYIAEQNGEYRIDLFVRDRLGYSCRMRKAGGRVLNEETTDWSEVTAADMLICSERALFCECESAARRARTRMTQGIGQAGIVMMAQAKALALTENLLTEDAVSFTRVRYATEDKRPGYQVTYRVGIEEYDYRVDARTGEVTGGGRVRPAGNAWDRLLEAEGIGEADLLCWTADVSDTDWSYTLTLDFLDGTRRVFRVDLETGQIAEKP